MSEDPEASKRRAAVRLGALAAVLFVATAALYWPACRNGFVNFDDDEYVTSTPEVLGGLRPDGIVWALTAKRAANWHPVTWWSLQADAELFGTGPDGFHRTNVLLHATNTALLFLTLYALTGAVGRAFLVAVLFAVHPQHVESVAWVSERKDVLSAFFFLLTLLLYVRYVTAPTRGRMVAVGVALALGLAAKPMLVTLPCVLLLLDFWPLGRVPWPVRSEGRWRPEVRALIVEKLPLFALVMVTAVLTVGAQQDQAIRSLAAMPAGARIANALVSYAAYLGQTVYPTDLAVFYPHPNGGFPAWQVGAAFLVVAALTTLALRQARRRPYLLVGWLWYLGMLVPVIGLVQVGDQARADRYTYLPHIGLFVAIVWGAADALADRPRLRASAIGGAILAAVAFALVTHTQIAVWENGRTLWEHALAVTADNYSAEAHLSDLDFAAGDKATAAGRIERAVRIRPGNGRAEQRLGELLTELGRPAEGIEHYREAVRLNPREIDWRNRLADLLLDAGRLGEAEEEYQTMTRLGPAAAAAGRFGLGRVAVRRGHFSDATVLFARGNGRSPSDPDFVLELGHALADGSWHEEAAGMYARALQLRPDDITAHTGLGNMMAARNRWTEAVTEYTEAVRLEPQAPTHRFALAHALARAGRAADAEREYATAVQKAPDWPEQAARTAWQLATHPDPARRLGGRAVHVAEQASEARGGHSAELLDVLAAAYAEAGRWGDAVAAADRAATAADTNGRPDLAVQIRTRRALYDEHRPYRQALTTP